MSRCISVPTLILCAASMWVGQSAAPPSSPQTASPDGQRVTHAVLPVRLSKSIDSKKAKQGDPILGKTAAAARRSDGTAIPSGTKVVGHVTEAKARSKGDTESLLGIVFDKIEMPGGKELEIKGTLQAIAPAPVVETGAAGSGTLPQQGLDAGSTAPIAAQAADSGSKSGSTPTLNGQSRGVVGFRNLELRLDSVLASRGKEIKLESGTQMMLKVQIE